MLQSLLLMLVLVLLAFAVILPAVGLRRAGLAPWTRTLAALLASLAVLLLVFAFSEDDYRQDGRTNWEVYPIEYALVPTVVGLALGAVWLIRSETSRLTVVAAPLLAMAGAFGTFMSVLLTAN